MTPDLREFIARQLYVWHQTTIGGDKDPAVAEKRWIQERVNRGFRELFRKRAEHIIGIVKECQGSTS